MASVTGWGGRLNLVQRLAQGRIPEVEAVRWATLLAESLRKAHEEGRVHGSLTPSLVWQNGRALELAPPPAGPRTVTPYTAPELLSGKPPDSRSDIFSFGAILYEMLTGEPKAGQPISTGSCAADKILAGCLATDPARRWQQIQKVILELKLLGMAVRHVEAGKRPPIETAPGTFVVPPSGEAAAAPFQAPAASPSASPLPEPAAPLSPTAASRSLFPDTLAQPLRPAQPLFAAPFSLSPDFSVIRGEIQQTENRLTARLQLGEKAMAVLNRAVADALTGLRSQVAALTTRMSGIQERPSGSGTGDAVSQTTLAHIELTLQAFGTRMEVIEKGIGVLQDRMGRSGKETDAAMRQVQELQTSIAGDFEAFGQNLRKQERAIDSTRTAMAQTDDLVERLVEALEALQAAVSQRSEEWTASMN